MDYHIRFNIEGIDIEDFRDNFIISSELSGKDFFIITPGDTDIYKAVPPQVKAAYILATGAVLSAGITALANCYTNYENIKAEAKANSPEIGIMRIVGDKGCSEIELIRDQPITESRIDLELDKTGKPLSVSFHPK